ncbi:MAG TPA: pilin [Gammaproteobacteria bacterium]|nr:pilin [Gammaproteobacteria bacterium]
MKQMQQGFTLIELMIVVAIIGILAAVAIPSYQDYTARAQVTEAMSLTSGMKTALAEYYADRGSFPTNPTVIGSTTSGKYVSNITFGTNTGGTLEVNATMKSSGVNADIQGKVFAIATTDGGNQWDCGEVGAAAADTDIDTQYLPGACKP